MSIIDRGPDKHGRQRFEVRVSCGYKNGKQVRVVKTFFCKTKKAAQKKMEQYLIQNNLSTEEFKSTYQTTFADFLAIWKSDMHPSWQFQRKSKTRAFWTITFWITSVVRC